MTVMTINWKAAKLDELGFVGRGKSRHRPRNAAFLYGGPYPFFQTGDIKAANFYLTEYLQTYSEEGRWCMNRCKRAPSGGGGVQSIIEIGG